MARTVSTPRLLLNLILSTLCAPALAFSWCCEGHQIIALIALKQLNPNALNRAHHLLRGRRVDSHLERLCGANTLDVFADVSTWADDIRNERRETASWHFIEIPLDAPRNDLNRFCPSKAGCVTKAIHEQMERLRSGNGTDRERAEALMFLIHFVGDLHQPLHTAGNGDRGGNCLPVTFFGTRPELQGNTPEELAKESFRPNLHGVWDNDLVAKVSGKWTVTEFSNRLSREFVMQIALWKEQSINVDNWAWENHRQAVRTAYGQLSKPVPREMAQTVGDCSDNNHVSQRMKRLNERLGNPYLRAARPVLKEQLVKAGTRLAMLLNQLWP